MQCGSYPKPTEPYEPIWDCSNRSPWNYLFGRRTGCSQTQPRPVQGGLVNPEASLMNAPQDVQYTVTLAGGSSKNRKKRLSKKRPSKRSKRGSRLNRSRSKSRSLRVKPSLKKVFH